MKPHPALRSRSATRLCGAKFSASLKRTPALTMSAESRPFLDGSRDFSDVILSLTMVEKRIDEASISRDDVREAQEILHRHLKEVGLKHTEQRDTILRTFLETRDHLSTDELHRLVKRKDPKIGITTVYRTLKLLSECGLASEVPFPDGITRFEHQYNRRIHHHMICTRCGSSVEFFSPAVDELEQEIGRKHHYQTTGHTFQIYGICEDCTRKPARRKPS